MLAFLLKLAYYTESPNIERDRMTKLNRLLVEKYRPTSFDTFVFQNEGTRKKLEKWEKEKEFPSILISGSPGTGKTTTSRILVEVAEIQQSDVLVINASMLQVSYIREVLEPWMKKASFSKFKVVQLEELDRPQFAVQKALLTIIENYSDTVRFIATCNYPSKVDPALHSRLQPVEMSTINEEGILDLIVDIVEKEGITFAEDLDLFDHIDTFKPDIRKIINSIDAHTDVNNVLRAIDQSYSSVELDAWEDAWKSGEITEDKLKQLFEITELVDMNNFDWFYQIMYENSKCFPDESKGIILLSQYLDRAGRSANQRLHLEAFLYHAFVLNDEE